MPEYKKMPSINSFADYQFAFRVLCIKCVNFMVYYIAQCAMQGNVCAGVCLSSSVCVSLCLRASLCVCVFVCTCNDLRHVTSPLVREVSIPPTTLCACSFQICFSVSNVYTPLFSGNKSNLDVPSNMFPI